MLVACAVRPTAAPLTGDEGATLSAATRSVPQIFELAKHVDGVIAPYYLYIKGFVSLFGDSALVLRAPSIVAVSLGVGVVAELARRFWGTAAGIAAGLICVTLPSLSRFGLLARPYATVFLLASLATLLLFRALERPTWRRFGAYGACVALCGTFHLISLTLLVGHLGVVLMRRDPHPLRRMGAVIAAVLALLSPLAVIGLLQRNRQLFWLARPSWATLRAMPSDLALNGAAAFLLIGLALAAAGIGGRAHRELLAVALLPIATVWAFALLIAPVWEPRYAAFVLGPLAILAGAGLTSAPRGQAVVKIAIALAILTTMTLPDQERIRGGSGPDPRAVADIILDNAMTGDAMAFGDGSWSTRATVTYYLGREVTAGESIPDDALMRRSAADIGQLTALECQEVAECLNGFERVWLISTTSYDTDHPLSNGTAKMTALSDCFTVAETWPLENARVTLLVRKDCPDTPPPSVAAPAMARPASA
jgi:mannosyltransferase